MSWTSTRVRYVARLNPAAPDWVTSAPDLELSFLPMEAIGEDASLRLDQTRPVETVRNGYSFFQDGDVAFAKVTPCFENGKAAVMSGLAGGAGFGTTELTVARANWRIDSRFLFYVLTQDRFRQLGQSAMTGAGGLKRVPDLFTRDFAFSLPSLGEQQRIVDFLDGETAQIDELIVKQERLIKLLAEKRQAIVTHAVTRGLDPSAPTKPSGVPWLGEIPTHWESSRMSYEVWVRARLGWKGLKAEEYVDEGIAFLSTPNIKSRRIDLTDVNRITPIRYEESPEIKLSVDDVLLAKDGSTLGTVNVVRDLPEPMTVNSSIAVLSPTKRIDGVYLYHMLQSDFLQNTIQLLKGGMGVPHLFQDDIKRFRLPIPPVAEQKSIAAYLDHTTDELDAIVHKVQTATGLLRERRSALISAAVTGKIDVREGTSSS